MATASRPYFSLVSSFAATVVWLSTCFEVIVTPLLHAMPKLAVHSGVRAYRKGAQGMASTTSVPLAGKSFPSEDKLTNSRVKTPEELVPWLACTLALDIPVLAFTVESLFKLGPGSLVRTSFHQSSDIPLQVNGVAMAWAEFEVVGDSLAARITDLI